MGEDGNHLICERHKKKSYYSSVDKEWRCVECEVEEALLENKGL